MALKIKNGKLIPLKKEAAKPAKFEAAKPYFSCANSFVETEFYDKQTIVVLNRGNKEYLLLSNDEMSALYACFKLNMTTNHPEAV